MLHYGHLGVSLLHDIDISSFICKSPPVRMEYSAVHTYYQYVVCHLELMTSFLLCFSTVLIFKSLNLCWSVEYHSKWGGLNQCCGVWLPICGAWILLHRGKARHASSCSPPLRMKTWHWQFMYLSLFLPVYR